MSEEGEESRRKSLSGEKGTILRRWSLRSISPALFQSGGEEEGAKGESRADQKEKSEIEAVDQIHPEGRGQGKSKIEDEEEIAEALPPVGLRTDIGDEGG